MAKHDLDRMKQSQAAKAGNLAEWRKSRLHETTLPSGLDVVLRDVSMTDLLFTGKLPDAMLDIAQASAENKETSIDLKQMAKSGQDLKTLVDQLTLVCLVHPAIGDVADDTHITLDELTGDDKMFIFNWVNREVEQVRSFREGEDQPAEVV